MFKKIILIGLIFTSYSSYSQGLSEDQKRSLMENSRKFSTFLYYLTSGYIEERTSEDLTEDAIKEVLAKLDPHSSYLSKEEVKESNQSFDGNFEGIGIEFNVLRDTIMVVSPIKGGPSEQVGLKSGDRIVKVDGKSVIGLKQLDVPKILRGPKGTDIVLEVVRHDEPEPLIFNIVRDKIPMYSLDAAYTINDTIGYVKLNRFMATTVKEYKEALDSMPQIKSLILDLRGNTGGFLDQAIRLSNQFLPRNKLIVYTEGRVFPRRDEMSTFDGNFTKGRVVVLVDEESASASEIVAGAIQDHDRGVIMGRQTFGKGLVQQQIQLPDSSAIRLTIARYHTPSGRVIQRPYDMGDKKKYYSEYYKRYTSGELINKDSLDLSMPDSLKTKTLKLGRPVFGGGGITPDVFVGIDTTKYSKGWSAIIRSGVIGDYVVDVFDENRKKLRRKYPTFDEFEQNYVISDEFIEELVRKAKEKGAEVEISELDKNIDNVKNQLKALMAQKLWDFTEMYRIINQKDEVILKAVEVLGKPENEILK